MSTFTLKVIYHNVNDFRSLVKIDRSKMFIYIHFFLNQEMELKDSLTLQQHKIYLTFQYTIYILCYRHTYKPRA